LKDVLLGSHKPARSNRRRSAKRDILHELRLLDGSISCWRWSLHLGRIALRKGHVLWRRLCHIGVDAIRGNLLRMRILYRRVHVLRAILCLHGGIVVRPEGFRGRLWALHWS
jgi:hypothetical protein